MKRKIKYLLFIIFCNIFIANVNATSINASAGKSQIQEGQTVKVSITVSSEETLGSWGFSVGYDSSVLQYVSSDLESGLTSVGVGNGSTKNKTYTVTFKGKKAGTGSVSIKSPWVYSWAEKTMKVSTRGASIKVSSPNNNSNNTTKSNTTSNKTKNESANNNLSSLSVDKYDLNPKFNKNTTSYDISVPNEVREIKVNAKADDSKASVKGTGNIKLNEGKNKVNITVTAENGNRKTYTINVNVKDKNPIIVNVDGEEYNVVQKKEELNSPSNYKETTATINGTEVPALTSDITNFTLVGLTDKNGKTRLYIYENDKYTLYNEYKFSGINIYLKDPSKDRMLEDLEETEININDDNVKAYKLKGNTYPLLYGINLDNGEENWYTYEESEKTLQKFAVGRKNDSSAAKFVNSKDSNNDKYKYLSIILGGISGVLFIFLVIAGIRLSMNKKSDIEFDFVDNDNDEKLTIGEVNDSTDENHQLEEDSKSDENVIDGVKKDEVQPSNEIVESKITDVKTGDSQDNTKSEDNKGDVNLEKTNIDIIKSDTDDKKAEDSLKNNINETILEKNSPEVIKIEQNETSDISIIKGKWPVTKLIIGIISMVLCILIMLQSCAAGLNNAILNNGSNSGSAGFICALFMLIGGIISVVTRNSKRKSGTITATIFYWFAALLTIGTGNTYGDLPIWGSVSFSFGLINFGSILATKKYFSEQKKSKILVTIVIIISIIAFIVGCISSSKGIKNNLNSNYKSDSSNDEDDSNINNKNNYKLGDTFKFDDLEISIGKNISFTTIKNEYSENNGKEVVVLPITVKNIKNETHKLNMYYYKIYGSKGTELDTFSTYFDDSIDLAGNLRTDASYSKNMYFIYDGNGKYAIEFDDYSTKITVEFDVTK